MILSTYIIGIAMMHIGIVKTKTYIAHINAGSLIMDTKIITKAIIKLTKALNISQVTTALIGEFLSRRNDHAHTRVVKNKRINDPFSPISEKNSRKFMGKSYNDAKSICSAAP